MESSRCGQKPKKKTNSLRELDKNEIYRPVIWGKKKSYWAAFVRTAANTYVSLGTDERARKDEGLQWPAESVLCFGVSVKSTFSFASVSNSGRESDPLPHSRIASPLLFVISET